MKVVAVPCYMDNYAWILYCDKRHEAMIVDACEGIPLLRMLDELRVEPVAICCTHHHADHTGGLPELQEVWPQVKIFCHISDLARIDGAGEGLDNGDTVEFCGHHVQVLHTPGHTLGSLCYYIDDYLFTGDTLFGGGCGRMFEGQPKQMAASMQRLASLPERTKVCFGHEYTLANLKFAAFLEPENQEILARQQEVIEQRRRGEGTAPSILAEELRTNPFLRCADSSLAIVAKERFAAHSTGISSVFAALRQAKDVF